jgi:hypothetical protein
MAARQFLGGISIDRRELTLDLHVSTNMADAQRPDWQKSVTLDGTAASNVTRLMALSWCLPELDA